MSTNAIEQRVIEMLDETGTDLSDEMKQRAVAVMVESVVEYSHQLLQELLADTGSLTEELMNVRDQQDTIVEWADFEGAAYVELDGEAEIVPGVRVLPTPGHSPGHQSVLVDTDEGLVILGGDVGHTWKEFDASESGRLLLDLRPRRIWLSHQSAPRDF